VITVRPTWSGRVPARRSEDQVREAQRGTRRRIAVEGLLNYAVLHAKASKPFREQFSPDRLKEVFKVFVEKHIDIRIIAAKTPLPTEEAKIDDDGNLILIGYFDTTPSHVYYDLKYVLSDGEWKPIKINVNVKAPDKK